MNITPKRFIQGFCVVVLLLALLRAFVPGIAGDKAGIVVDEVQLEDTITTEVTAQTEETDIPNPKTVPLSEPQQVKEIDFVPHRIYSVSNFKTCFPDENDVQLISAEKNGIRPCVGDADFEQQKSKLVYVGSNPYFKIDRLKTSYPYLVPKASALLQDIGSNFYDSLQIKGIPLHRIIVTSVLRTKEQVQKLSRHNQNAMPNSCHMYATTFDICYNRYETVEDPDGPRRRQVRNDSLKWVLSEVLNDIRKDNRCHIKYEVKQGCYHITVK